MQDLDAPSTRRSSTVFARNRAENAQLVIVGDKCQCIYQFYGADERYLTYAPRLSTCRQALKKLLLHHSWRLSMKVTEFINRVILKGDTPETCKHVALKAEYHTVNLFQSKDSGVSEVLTASFPTTDTTAT